MKVCWFGFAAQNHSWAIVAQNICRQLIKQGHMVDMFSTNGNKHFPQDLQPYLKGFIEEKHSMNLNELNIYASKILLPEYDMQLSYTAFKNYPFYFVRGAHNRFGIWTYEMQGKNAIPDGWAKYHQYVDQILPPSNFAKEVFLNSGVPNEKMTVIPHGYDVTTFSNASRGTYPLKTHKRFKILVNVAQPHIRKALDLALTAYGKAFTKQDDVCLVLKVVDKVPALPFEVSFKELYANFTRQFPQHAEVEIITTFIDEIDTLYRACDAIFSMTRSEAFWMPGPEAMACNLIPIVSGWGGQLDFLNHNNALLITGREVPVPMRAFYWGAKQGPHYFEPNVIDAVEKLQYAYYHTQELKDKYHKYNENILPDYTWEKVAKDIVSLTK